MANNKAKVILSVLMTCLILFISVAGCTSNAGPLEELTDQVTLSSLIGPEMYTYPGTSKILHVECDNSKNLPHKPVYTWTVFLDGGIIHELTHDKYVSLREEEEEEEEEVEEKYKWPCTDEIKLEFLREGTYKIRIDLYDNDEYKALKNLAPRRGTYTYTVHCEPVKVTIKAMPTGESRKYNVKATIENKRVLGLFNYPEWRFVDWKTGNIEKGITEKITDITDITDTITGIDEITHQFQLDSDYKIMFFLKDENQNEIARTEIMLNVKGTDLVIKVPEQPFKTGQEYTLKAQQDHPEYLPEAPVYDWDFGDNNGIIIPFSNEATHLYEREGTYTVKVEIFASEVQGAPLLGTATAKVKVVAGTTNFLTYIQQTTHLLVGVRGNTTYHQSDGLTREVDAVNLSVYSGQPSTTWQGTHFTNKYLLPATASSSGISVTIEGDVSKEGDKVVNLTATVIYDDSHRKAGEKRETRISLGNVKLEPKSSIPLTDDPNYKPQFTAYIEGPEVANFVNRTFYEHKQPKTSDPNFKMWYDPLKFTNTNNPPHLLVVFKSIVINAHDDPSY